MWKKTIVKIIPTEDEFYFMSDRAPKHSTSQKLQFATPWKSPKTKVLVYKAGLP